ncbi:MAG TPA: FAD:protein FMN transferase [Longimicrobiales bacterium]|nr:FAD:protein FMN transferase [Longimicrobiales bacterium]
MLRYLSLIALSASCALLAPAAVAAECAGSEVVERTTYQMGTLLRVRVEAADRACGLAAIDMVLVEVTRLERVLSSWTTASEIGAVNAASPGATVMVTRELAGLLAEAGVWVEGTGGAFDPAVGALVDVWALRGAGRLPTATELAAARAATGWRHLRLDRAGRTVTRGPAGWWLDTGAFGKGVALRAAASVLRSHGVRRAVVDFGGQLLVLGEAEVSVSHPAQRDVVVARVSAREASVATSSASERFVEAAGRRMGHVVDPRTGEPVAAWGSVTVLSGDALEADALATALFVMGRAAALAWAAAREVGVLVLWQDGGRVHAEWNEAMNVFVLEAPTRERSKMNTNGKENRE